VRVAVKALEVGNCTFSHSGRRRRGSNGIEAAGAATVEEHELIDSVYAQTGALDWQQVLERPLLE
jgi:hypothetical protein